MFAVRFLRWFFFIVKSTALVFPHEPSDRSFHRHFSFCGQVIVSVPQRLMGLILTLKHRLCTFLHMDWWDLFPQQCWGGKNAIRRHLFVIYTPLMSRAVLQHFSFKLAVFVPFVETGLTLSTDTLGSK